MTKTLTQGHECGIVCTGARGPASECICECGGADHGLLLRPGRASTPETQARTMRRMPTLSDDTPF